MIARVETGTLTGFEAAWVEVETDMKQGLPGVHLVGLGNKAISESRERVRSAIKHSLLDFPPRKFVISLAPAELPKDGSHFDLPIALSILVASGQLKQTEVSGALFAGELSLSGELRPIRGAINLAELAVSRDVTQVFLPQGNAIQASLVKGVSVFGVTTLKELFLHLKGISLISPTPFPRKVSLSPSRDAFSLDDIVGQDQAKRALQIAIAGRHNILMIGPPGSGKTLLARTLPGLLPPLSLSECLEVTKLHSLAGLGTGSLVTTRPFRSPHHTVSPTALVGGGGKPRPGEISLTHTGVLFLDEIPEFSHKTLEALRQPLEDRFVSIARTHGHTKYPADVMLVAAMNPCPCGFYGSTSEQCTCSLPQITAYQKRLSGPLLDRIDLIISVPKVKTQALFFTQSLQEKHQSKVLELISIAILHQKKRYISSSIYNATISSSELKATLKLTASAKDLMANASDRLNLTGRGYFKTLRVAQTIADLDASPIVDVHHVAEALQYRNQLLH